MALGVGALMAIYAAIAAAIAAASSYAANEQNNNVLEAQGEAANKESQFKYSALQQQFTQVNEQKSQERLKRQVQAAKERGRLVVQQGAAGVGGNSSMRALNTVIMQERMDSSVIEGARDNQRGAIISNMHAAYLHASGEQNVAEAGRYSPIGTSINIVGSAFQGAMAGYGAGAGNQPAGPRRIDTTPADATNSSGTPSYYWR